MTDNGIIYPKEGDRNHRGQIGGTTAGELLFFWWGRHDGRRAGEGNFVLLGVACKMASDGRRTANQDGTEMERLGSAAGIIMSQNMQRMR